MSSRSSRSSNIDVGSGSGSGSGRAVRGAAGGRRSVANGAGGGALTVSVSPEAGYFGYFMERLAALAYGWPQYGTDHTHQTTRVPRCVQCDHRNRGTVRVTSSLQTKLGNYYSGVRSLQGKVERCFLDVILVLDYDTEVPGTSKASPELVLNLQPLGSGLEPRGKKWYI